MNYKIQVLNGYRMYFDQIVSIFKSKYDTQNNINIDELSTLCGLNRRKTRLILNYLADIGLSEKRTLNKTELGNIIHKHDEFFQDIGTLWILHYLQSTNDYLVIWNRVMNSLFDINEFSKENLMKKFDDLENTVSEYTFSHHIGKEIRIIIDAYTNQKFNKLNLIEKREHEYFINRNQDIPELILLFALIKYKEQNYPGSTAIDIKEVCENHNSPGRIFIIDEYIIREKLEKLKNLGFISLESRGNLDQIRFNIDMTFGKAISIYYNKYK